jgi:hypothetical protein
MGFQVICMRGEAKGLTVEVECNVGTPHNDRQRHHNLVSVPNCNASGIDEQLIPERLPLCGVVDENIRAKDNQ